eukprot:10002278-Lingulodinium_polyedra.AAC.1
MQTQIKETTARVSIHARKQTHARTHTQSQLSRPTLHAQHPGALPEAGAAETPAGNGRGRAQNRKGG